MAVINPYLNFNGTCEEAFNFYKSVFGGEFGYVGRFSEMPPDPNQPPMPAEMQNRIMHISLSIGGSQTNMLMGSDTGGEWASNHVVGNNISISIGANSKEEADRIFNGLAEGGTVTMPLANVFWGDYFGMCIDKFGINWMMSFNENYKPQ
jgi:PhnB protein